MYASAEQRQREIAAGATLSPAALCTLFCDSAEQLDVKWRNLQESAWATPVRTAQGRTVAASDAVWMRTREVWIHAVDLDNGTQFTDMPEVVQTSLLGDIVGLWQAKNLGSDLVIEVTGTKPLVVDSSSIEFRIVRGTLAAVVRWAAGRGAIGVACDGPVPQPPHWL